MVKADFVRAAKICETITNFFCKCVLISWVKVIPQMFCLLIEIYLLRVVQLLVDFLPFFLDSVCFKFVLAKPNNHIKPVLLGLVL